MTRDSSNLVLTLVCKCGRGGVPPESVEDHRVIAVDGVGVVRRQTQVAHLHLVAGYPVMHHGEAGVEGGPA